MIVMLTYSLPGAINSKLREASLSFGVDLDQAVRSIPEVDGIEHVCVSVILDLSPNLYVGGYGHPLLVDTRLPCVGDISTPTSACFYMYVSQVDDKALIRPRADSCLEQESLQEMKGTLDAILRPLVNFAVRRIVLSARNIFEQNRNKRNKEEKQFL